MTDHTISAHFVVDASAGLGQSPSLEQITENRVVRHMVSAMCSPDSGAFAGIQAEHAARAFYRMHKAMVEALKSGSD